MILDSVRLQGFKHYDDHEYVVEIVDPSTNLHAFVAIHNSKLGPATGGTRVYSYSSDDDAITDALRLSKAMTYKCALSGVKHGGGKGVIMANSNGNVSKASLRSYANHLNQINSNVCGFTTGEDVGLSDDDIHTMSKCSVYIVGAKQSVGGPSPYAALSTFVSIKSAVNWLDGKNSLKNYSVAVKGVGKVGSSVVDMLIEEGAKVYIADVDKEAVKKVVSKHKNVSVVNPDEIHTLEVDVYSPCAMGNEFTADNVSKVRARIICGAANNQLESAKVGDMLYKRGIVYVPDYIANAGGLINVVDDLRDDGYNKQRVLNNVEKIKFTVKNILDESQIRKKSTNRVADEIATKISNNTDVQK